VWRVQKSPELFSQKTTRPFRWGKEKKEESRGVKRDYHREFFYPGGGKGRTKKIVAITKKKGPLPESRRWG